jgi:transposase-like protein
MKAILGLSNMKSAEQILHEHRIALRFCVDNKYATTCPRCSHQRKKKSARCLSVRIDREGVRFKCHHCGWQGRELYEQRFKSTRDRSLRGGQDLGRDRRALGDPCR